MLTHRPQEINTSDPSFYKHTQRIFLALYEAGLAYQAEAEVNYDPVDKTVLANEQVDANGRSWRSGAVVEKRMLKQWFFRISAYRDVLLADLDALSADNAWPEKVLTMQRNWLGRSQGAVIRFPIVALAGASSGPGVLASKDAVDVHAAIEVFTTRPETLFGAQYVALASTHPVVSRLARSDPELQAFLDTLPGLPPDSKVGYLLPHIRAVNPLAYHDDTPPANRDSLPVYVAPYVVGDYGEGAIMGVPAHDERDHAFWRKQRGSSDPVRFVLAAEGDESTTVVPSKSTLQDVPDGAQSGASTPYLGHGVMTEHAGPFKGKSSKETGRMLVDMLRAAGGLARTEERWRLRDWLVSRQRYWGTPIPIVHCQAGCGAVPVPVEQLPVELPSLKGRAGMTTGNPLEMAEDWLHTTCPKCGGPGRRETDTMDTFVDSSWYYARYIDPRNEDTLVDPKLARDLLPVDVYVGGVEHAILHLLYARFMYKFLWQSGLLGEPTVAESESKKVVHEPFARLVTQGMVHGKTYVDPSTGRFLRPDEVRFDERSPSSPPTILATGKPAEVRFEKMSKSKYNGVDPTRTIATYGADATRAHMLFQAPVADVLCWDEDKISGVTRWLGRVYDVVEATPTTEKATQDAVEPRAYLEQRAEHLDKSGGSQHEQLRWDADAAVWRAVQAAIASVTAAYEKVYALNTVVSDLMILTNTLEANEAHASPLIRREAASALVRMMAPIAPALAEECWSLLHPHRQDSSVFVDARFPVEDGSADTVLRPRVKPCAVQVNGRLRFVVDIPQPPSGLQGSTLDDWVVEKVLNSDAGRELRADVLHRNGFQCKKIIVVRGGKTVNFVVQKKDS